MTCGIYAIINEELGRIVYVGRSHNIEGRVKWVGQSLRRGEFGGSTQELYLEQGKKSFSWEILEETIPEELVERENYWIKLYQPENNIHANPRYPIPDETLERLRVSHLGKQSRLGIPFSEESKLKISQSLQGRVAWNKGKKMSDGYRERARQGSIGNRNHAMPHSEETKHKLRGIGLQPEERERRRQRALAQHAKRRAEGRSGL